MDGGGTASPTGMGLVGPPNPLRPDQRLAPFQAALSPPQAHHLRPGSVHEVDIAETTMAIHPRPSTRSCLGLWHRRPHCLAGNTA